MTPAEQIVFYCRQMGYPEPVPEFRFHPTRQWRFDLSWPGRKVALELEGVTYSGGGRHQRPKGYAADCEKYTEAALVGWTLIRCTYTQLRSGQVYPWLDRALGEKATAE